MLVRNILSYRNFNKLKSRQLFPLRAKGLDQIGTKPIRPSPFEKRAVRRKIAHGPEGRVPIWILIFVFYFLVLFQGSFLAHFSIKGATPNLVFILVLLFNFFSSAENGLPLSRRKLNKYIGLWAAVIGGFLSDVFSTMSPFGVSLVSFLLLYFFIKKFLHLLKEPQDRFPFFYFLPVFLFSFIFYELFLVLIYYLFHSSLFNLKGCVGTVGFLIKLVYNAILGILGFYVFKAYLWISQKNSK